MKKDLKIAMVKDLVRVHYLKNDKIIRDIWLFLYMECFKIIIGFMTTCTDNKDTDTFLEILENS